MRVEGAPYPLERSPYLVGTSCALRTLFSCMLRILVGKNSLYNLPKVLTTVSRKYPLFFLSCFLLELSRPGIMSSPFSNNEGNDAWLMKIELKREERGEINKDDRIKKAMEDHAPAA